MSAWRQWISGPLLLLASAAVSAQNLADLHERVSAGPEPEWVRPTELEPPTVAATDDSEPVSYLLVDDQVRVPQSGPAESYYRKAYRINARAALEDWSSWEIDFEPTYQRVIVHHLQVYREGTWHDRLEHSRWSVLRRESDLARHMFDQRHSLLVLLDDVRVGDVVSVAYSLYGENPVFDGRLAESYGIGWGLPVKRRRLRARVHARRDVRFAAHGVEAESTTQRDGDWVEHLWDLSDLPDYEYDFDVPADWIVQPWIEGSEYREWSDVVAWALPLYGSTGEIPAELTAVAREIDGGAPGDRVATARNWVQDEVRYLAILLGEHSHAPHRAAEIVRRRYGDCKDKTVVLIALLRAMGIEAWPALVNTAWHDGIRTWLPSPNAFDHVIVVAGSGAERVWLDPTLTSQGGSGHDLFVPPYEAALIIKPGETGLTAMPESQSDPGVIRALYEYRLTEANDASVEIHTRYVGQAAEGMREVLSGQTQEDLLDGFVEYYATPGLTLTPRGALEIEDDRGRNHVRIVERYSMRFDPDDESGVFFETLPLIMMSDLYAPEGGERTAPLALTYPLEREETVVLVAPPEIELEPVEQTEENPWFRFSVDSKMGEGIELTYRLETLTDRVQPADLEAYGAAVLRMQENLGYVAFNEPLTTRFKLYIVIALLGFGLFVILIVVAGIVAWRKL